MDVYILRIGCGLEELDLDFNNLASFFDWIGLSSCPAHNLRQLCPGMGAHRSSEPGPCAPAGFVAYI